MPVAGDLGQRQQQQHGRWTLMCHWRRHPTNTDLLRQVALNTQNVRDRSNARIYQRYARRDIRDGDETFASPGHLIFTTQRSNDIRVRMSQVRVISSDIFELSRLSWVFATEYRRAQVSSAQFDRHKSATAPSVYNALSTIMRSVARSLCDGRASCCARGTGNTFERLAQIIENIFMYYYRQHWCFEV